MDRRSLLMLAVSSAAVMATGPLRALAAEEGYRVSGPRTHGNLSIYFVHGPSAPGPVPLTLQEAVAGQSVHVYETGSVNELQIENLGKHEVFVQSGDIVKGGKQDRVLMVSLLLPPRSGRVSIASFCVEQGRWSARGGEEVGRFASAEQALPSRRAKLAMKAPMPPRAEPQSAYPADMQGDPALAARGGLGLDPRGQIPGSFAPRTREVRRSRSSETGERQQAVWSTVASVQQKLSGNVGHSVASPQSQSSLQLSLENEKLKERKAAYVKALKEAGETGDDIVGFAFAINGKINSADVYPSNGLFRKMWAKLLDASVIEAIGDRGEEAGAPPSTEQVLAFLKVAEGGRAEMRDLPKSVRLETRDGDQALYFATERAGGGFVHRNYLAK